MKLAELNEITKKLREDKELCKDVLLILLMDNTISINELVAYKEAAINAKLSQNKENLAAASALLLRHLDKINVKGLKEETRNFINEQGFFKA